MKNQIYERQDLPIGELQKVGLIQNGLLKLDEDNLDAMLSGRRTDMLRLENLMIEGLPIDSLDAKLSLKPNANGVLELRLHPIYREPQIPHFLEDDIAKMLEKGLLPNLPMTIIGDDGKPKEVLIEFDKDTCEFIVSDSGLIIPPEEINGVPLTPRQRERYRKGRAVDTRDGTTIVYSATTKEGIRSSKPRLIATVQINGGIAYVWYRNLQEIFGRQQDKQLGRNYEQALAEFRQAQARSTGAQIDPIADREQDGFVTFSH